MAMSPSRMPCLNRSSSLPSFPLPHNEAILPPMPSPQPLTEFLRKEAAGNRDILLSPAFVDIYSARPSLLLETNATQFSEEPVLDFLDSYLRYRKRWYEFRDGRLRRPIAGDVTGEIFLSNQVLMFLQRMSSMKEPCTENACGCAESEKHAEFLRWKNWLDLPKLMDICAIYGHDNPSITKETVKSAVEFNPSIISDISLALSYFIETFQTIYNRCFKTHKILNEFPKYDALTRNQQLTDLLEAMDFINDAIVTMDSFIDAYKPAAFHLSLQTRLRDVDYSLLNILGRIHDLLLPLYQKGLTYVPPSLSILLSRISKCGWRILDISYLSYENFGEIIGLQTFNTVFPANVDDPISRGDIIYRMLQQINLEVTSHVRSRKDHITFLCNMEREYSILARLTNLCNQGWIFLDDPQLNRISTFVASYFLQYDEKRILKIKNHQADLLLEPNINQLQILFPHYSKAFILACLKFYNKNSEEVIRRISNDTLHDFFRQADPSSSTIKVKLYSP